MIGRAAACGAAMVLVLFSTPAPAHEEMALHALTVIDSVTPAIDGLDVRVVHLGGPALVVENETGELLRVFDGGGEEFLRIGPRGVYMDSASPMAYRSLKPGGSAVPPDVRTRGRSRWVKVSGDPAWTWFDPRLVYDQTDPKWEVEMVLGDTEITARGGYESLHGHGHFRTSLEPPAVEGLEMRLAEGPVPALFVRNETGRVLEVAGQAGEPMLRIGPKGVEANKLSPSYYTSAAQTIASVPRFADAGAAPVWKRLSSQPVWAWLEYRASLGPELQQRELLGEERSVVLEWEAPITLGGRPLDVRGQVEWLPPATTGGAPAGGTSLTPWWLATAAFVGAGVVFSSLRRNAAHA
jgi:hypothetical protein